MPHEPLSPLSKRLIEEGLAACRAADSPADLRLLAKADGYVMVRRPGCMPFVMREQDWRALRERAA